MISATKKAPQGREYMLIGAFGGILDDKERYYFSGRIRHKALPAH